MSVWAWAEAWRDTTSEAFPWSWLLVFAVGHAASLLCALFHWPFWKAGWRGPWPYLGVTGAGAGAALAFIGVPWEPAAVCTAFAGLTGINAWWIAYKGITLGHRIANGLWVLMVVVIFLYVWLVDGLCESGEWACDGY